MSRIALRLLLAFCLILNGVGTAMAAIAMPAMDGGSAHASMAMPVSEPLPASACDHVDGESAAAATPVDHAAASSLHPADCALDCCAQGSCGCPCVQLAQAALHDMLVSSAPPARAREVAALDLGHATPLLLNLIRPPIG